MKPFFTAGTVWVCTLLTGCSSTATGELVPNSVSSAATGSLPGSSYACEKQQAPGTSSIGEGSVGCHFKLHHPKTQKILANTPYKLTLFQAPPTNRPEPEPVFTFDGITDAQGRSVYVRSYLPIQSEHAQFVERVGTGAYGLVPRLIRPTDGLPAPGAYYQVDWCGSRYIGVSDERGNGAAFRSDNENCNMKVTFYKPRK